MRTSPLHAVAGALLCSTTANAFQEVFSPITHAGVSSLHPRSHGPLHLASRADDGSGGRRSPGYVPFGGSGRPYIPGRGSKEDDEEWFAKQVQMAEQERGSSAGGQPYSRFGSQQMRSQPGRPSVTPTTSAASRSTKSSNSRRPAAAANARSSSSSSRTTRRSATNTPDEPRSTIGTPTQTATSRNAAGRGVDRNSRAPQAIVSGSSANSSWFRGGNRSSPNGIQMPGAEQVQTPTQSMARLSGPRPVTKASTASPVSRAPITPGDAMRADTLGGAAKGGAYGQDSQQQQRPKSTGSWFNDQLMQQQFERERQRAVEEEFGTPRPGAGGGGNRNTANNNSNRNRPSAGFPSLPQAIGSRGNNRRGGGAPSLQGFPPRRPNGRIYWLMCKVLLWGRSWARGRSFPSRPFTTWCLATTPTRPLPSGSGT